MIKRLFSFIFFVSTVSFLFGQVVPDSFPEMKEQKVDQATVKGKRVKYSRKENPAVELMRKVIAAKKHTDINQKDFYRYDKYEKITFSLNEFTQKVLEEGSFKRMPFLKNHVEVCNETGKLILPITYNETISEHIYRKSPKTEKTIIKAQNERGVNELFNTGDILTDMLKECFTNVDIYKDHVRMLQYPFLSPIASGAINFYRFYLMDTVYVGKDKCIEVTFTPNNAQDFGFSGSLFITTDSSYRVRSISIGIPKRSDVNFVEDLRVVQEFETLPSGEQILLYDDMIVQIKVASFLNKMQVRRTTHYSGYNFADIPQKEFKIRGSVKTDPDAMMKSNDFWNKYRPLELTDAEKKIPLFIKEMRGIKHFKEILFVLKAFIENFVETSTNPEKPSKIDIGPVNTVISQNSVDGLRLRASAQTTANLNPHIFGKGYLAYGFKDNRWKGMGELTYSFNKKEYLPREYPVNNLSVSYKNDVTSPSDKFLATDKDNVFTSFRFTKVDQMMYTSVVKVNYEVEWENGLRFTTTLKREEDEPTEKLFYQTLSSAEKPTNDPSLWKKSLVSTEATVGIYYSPGVSYINTKQRRIATNKDAPILSLNHTIGFNGILDGEYNYNLTEARIYKRFWLSSWGKIDATLKGGIQWNQVPFPLLIMPAANLSYVMQSETFSLINNMEFMNDRYASLMVSWDLNGKIFNRVPLLKKLKWREYLGCNILWGTLSSKNNPFAEENLGNKNLFYFPGHFLGNDTFEYSGTLMKKSRPYVELVGGVHNIFKILHVEYVRRLNYLDNPNTKKWGIRFMMRISF